MGIVYVLSYFLPPILAYGVGAVLTITPQTRAFRIALWPVIALLAWRAVVSFDVPADDLDQRFNKIPIVISMIWMVTRALYWTIPTEPLVRHTRPVKAARSTLLDALDLALTMRGYGWDWSRGVHRQHETRPTNRIGFICHVVLSVAYHAFVHGVLHKVIRSFSPTGFGAARGSIFDDTLPWHVRYLRSSIITFLSLISLEANIQVHIDVCTLIGVVLFCQAPEQWPPAFNATWCATSISDYWARRWHACFRHLFLVQGGYPLRSLLGGREAGFVGRVGYIVGAFLSSASMHHVALVILYDQSEFWRVLVGFGMMAPVILVEDVYQMWTGRKVGGFAGWVWTMWWLFLGGNVIMDAFARAGMLACSTGVEVVVPRPDLVEYWVARFDSWLHGM